MESQRTNYGWVLRLDPGEEIVGRVAAFAARHGIRCGAITGLGSVGEAELGFFDPASRNYTRRVFTGDHELGALGGNVSDLAGEPFPHLHAVLGDREFRAFTGHLFRGVVSITCEVQLLTDPGTLARVARPDLGYNPLAPR